MIPLLLGLGNALVTVLAFAKLRWLSATILILIQVPWAIWDIANGLPGFLVLVPLGFVPMGMMLWERRKARRPVDWANVKLDMKIYPDVSSYVANDDEASNATGIPQWRFIGEPVCNKPGCPCHELEPEEYDVLEEHPGEPRLVPHLDALEEHKEHLRTFNGED